MFYAMYLKIVLYFCNCKFAIYSSSPKIKVTAILTIYPFVSFQNGGHSTHSEIGSIYIFETVFATVNKRTHRYKKWSHFLTLLFP